MFGPRTLEKTHGRYNEAYRQVDFLAMTDDSFRGVAYYAKFPTVVRPENWTNDRRLLCYWLSVQAAELNRLGLSH
jgi:hypothetical protein